MSTFTMRFLALAVIVLALASCRSATVYNVENASFNLNKPAPTNKVQAAIKQAGASLGWSMRDVAPGHIEARLPIRAHVAVADIFYNSKDFSIKYKDSTNLNYDPKDNTIHANYNGWVQNLEKAIRAQTSTL